MSDKRKSENDKELMIAIIRLLEAEIPYTEEELDELLIEDGVDIKAFERKMNSAIEEAMENSPYNWRNFAAVEAENAAKKIRIHDEYGSLSRKQLKQKFFELIESFSPARQRMISAYNRDFDELTDDDLRSLLDELKALQDGDT